MSKLIRAVLLSLALVAFPLMAAELTTAQLQQILSAAQGALPDGKSVQVTLTIDNVAVVFDVVRDATGMVIARPVAGTSGVEISQVSISSTVNQSGLPVPSAVVVVLNNHEIKSYNVNVNPDGTLASITPVGHFAPIARNGAGDDVVDEDGSQPQGHAPAYVDPFAADKLDQLGYVAPPAGAGIGDASPAR